MLALGALLLSLGSAGIAPDTLPTASPAGQVDTNTVSASSAPNAPVSPRIAPDSQQGRPKVVELSDWYYRRLTIHRYVAYGTLPVFAAQWAAGKRLYDDSREAPQWAKTTHRVGATLLAAGFTTNTVTGLWNLWEARSVEQGRVMRTVHGVTILVADGLFTYAGAKLSEDAERSADKRREHRTIALSAMALTTVSGVAMKLFNR